VIGRDGKGREVSARGTDLREIMRAAASCARDLRGRSAGDVYRHQAAPDEPIGEHLLDKVQLPDGSSIVLLDWMAEMSKDGRNLMRLDVEGRVLWTASPLDSTDCFVGIDWDGSELRANTMSCYRVSIDPNSGRVEVLHFTK